MYTHSIVAIAAGEKIKHLLSSLNKFPYNPPPKKKCIKTGKIIMPCKDTLYT